MKVYAQTNVCLKKYLKYYTEFQFLNITARNKPFPTPRKSYPFGDKNIY